MKITNVADIKWKTKSLVLNIKDLDDKQKTKNIMMTKLKSSSDAIERMTSQKILSLTWVNHSCN